MFQEIMMYVAYGFGGLFILWFAYIIYNITKSSPEVAAAKKEAKLLKKQEKGTSKDSTAKTARSVFSRTSKPAKHKKTSMSDNIGEDVYVPDLSVSNVAAADEERKTIQNPFTRPKVTPFESPELPEVVDTTPPVAPARAKNNDAVEETEAKPRFMTPDLSLDTITQDDNKNKTELPVKPRFNLPY